MLCFLQYSVFMKARNRLRVWRAERNITQMRLAMKVKMQPARLSHIENGHVEPSENERVALARALSAPLHEVFPPSEAVAS